MKQQLFNLVRNSSWYLASNLSSTFMGVLLLPLYTRFLTPNDYGITAMVASITAFLAAFFQLGLRAAYNRFYFEYQDNLSEVKRHVSTIVFFLASYGLALALLITFLGKPIDTLTPGMSFSPYIQLAVWSGYFHLIGQLRLSLYQMMQKPRSYFLLFVSHITFQTLLTIYMVVLNEGGALGYITAGLVSNIVFSFISLWLLRHYLAPVFDATKFKISLRYGLPLMPHMLSGWMNTLADRMILNNLVNTAETGIYTVGYAVGKTVNTVAMSINFAWTPYFFSRMKDEGDAAKGRIARFITYWVIVLCFIFLLLVTFSREIVTIFAAQQYHEAHIVVPLIALSALFTGFYYIVVAPLMWVRKTPIVTAGTLTSGVLNIGLNFLFIPRMQMMGAALATTLSSLYGFIFVALFSLRAFRLPYEYRRLLKILFITAICYLVSLPAANLGGFWITFAAKLPVIALFPLLIVLTHFMDEEEKNTVKNLLEAVRHWLYDKVFPSRIHRM